MVPALEISLSSTHLTFSNNELGFREEDVRVRTLFILPLLVLVQCYYYQYYQRFTDNRVTRKLQPLVVVLVVVVVTGCSGTGYSGRACDNGRKYRGEGEMGAGEKGRAYR